jgi:hypothetical protein
MAASHRTRSLHLLRRQQGAAMSSATQRRHCRPRRHGGLCRQRCLQRPPRQRQRRALRSTAGAYRGRGAACGSPRQRGGRETGVSRPRGCPLPLGGATASTASSAKAASSFSAACTTSSWPHRGHRGMGPVARSRCSGDQLATSAAIPATRTSPSAHGGLVVATGAL